MFKSGLILAGLTFSLSSFAFVNCGTSNSAVSCITINGGSEPHFLQLEIAGHTSRAACVPNMAGIRLPLDNRGASRWVRHHIFSTRRSNNIKFYQCSDFTCNQKMLVGDYNFKLSRDKETLNNFSATPPTYTVNMLRYGETCSDGTRRLSLVH